MNEITETQVDDPASLLSMLTAEASPLTPLAGWLLATSADNDLIEARGARTPAFFSDAAQELTALVTGAAAFDQGARMRLRITGEDRVRWLNGMVTNTVKSLATGTHNYTFILNAQGRIQGDATVFAFADHLILETDRSQAERLHAHLDRFIIMDDVELAWDAEQTSIGLSGPAAEALLSKLGMPAPEAGAFASPVGDPGITVIAESGQHVPRFSLWVAEANVASLWKQLVDAGASPAGAIAVDSLRVLEGIPLYGVDISEKTLAQETGQMRALNFSKGCYLGQEIVERVRSRASVHRGLRQFALNGQPVTVGAVLTSNGATAGELTSVATAALPGLNGQIALGIVRVEMLANVLAYEGGSAAVLARSPLAGPEATES